MNTISSDPYLGGGYAAIFSNLVGDASGGGARCSGCPFDAWDITEFEFKNDDLISWDNDGWITLLKEEADPSRYYFDYVNGARDESGVITNSYCVRGGSTDMSCTGPNLSNSIVKKIFTCYTDLVSVQNP